MRVDVTYKNRCSFPLTLKAYVISQQEKDSVPEWVPDDFLDPDLPQVRGLTAVTDWIMGLQICPLTAAGSVRFVVDCTLRAAAVLGQESQWQ